MIIKKEVMKLSAKSYWVIYYRFFYGISEYRLPKNFCPFFWKLLFALFVSTFWIWLVIPVTIYEIICGEDLYDDKPNERAFVGLGFYLVLWVLSIMLSGIALPFVYKNLVNDSYWDITIHLGAMVDIILTAFFIGRFIINLIKYYRDTNNEENHYAVERKPNVLVEGIKAWYHKRCPILEYEDLEEDVNDRENDFRPFNTYTLEDEDL